jgi:hypothetical protein
MGNILPRSAVRDAVLRALQLDPDLDAAIDTAAQALNLPPETVLECVYGEEAG